MKISIIIPTLNAAKFLPECLRSIDRQEHTDTEVIIVDGGSTDGTIGMASSFGPLVKLIASRNPKGEPDAINYGFTLATGQIVAYIDADDTYELGCFKQVNEFFSKHDCQWLFGKGYIVDEKGKVTRSMVTTLKEQLQKSYSYKKLSWVDFIVQPTVFWRKDFTEQIGEFNTKEKLVFDYEYLLRCAKVAEPGYIPEYLAAWRKHEGSASVQNFKQEASDAYRIAKRYGDQSIFTRLNQAVSYVGTNALYRAEEMGERIAKRN